MRYAHGRIAGSCIMHHADHGPWAGCPLTSDLQYQLFHFHKDSDNDIFYLKES